MWSKCDIVNMQELSKYNGNCSTCHKPYGQCHSLEHYMHTLLACSLLPCPVFKFILKLLIVIGYRYLYAQHYSHVVLHFVMILL